MDDNDFLQLAFNSLQDSGNSDAVREAVLRQLIEVELAARNEARREYSGERQETTDDYLERLRRQRLQAIASQREAPAAAHRRNAAQTNEAVKRVYADDQASLEARQGRVHAVLQALSAKSRTATAGLLNSRMSVGDAFGRMPGLPGMPD